MSGRPYQLARCSAETPDVLTALTGMPASRRMLNMVLALGMSCVSGSSEVEQRPDVFATHQTA